MIHSNYPYKLLGSVAYVVMGQSPSSSTYNNSGIGLPFFQGKAEFTEMYPQTVKWCNKPKKIAKPNDILISVRAPVGAINVALEECCIGRGLAAIRYENWKYLYYYLKLIRNELDKKGTGTTFNAISGEIIREIQVPFPLPLEQHRIVEKIEELFSDLDKGIETLEIARQQLKVYRQAVLKYAFEGKLTNKNVKDGELPKGWKRIALKNVCKKIIGGGTPSTKIEKYWNGDIPWISSADIYGINDIKPRRKITKEAVSNSATNILKKGGIIVVTRVGLGKLAFAPYNICFSQDSQGLELNEELIAPKYALLVLHKEVQLFKQQSRGTTISGVTKKQLADLNISFPPLKEQLNIVQEIESRLSVCDKMEETIKESLQQSEALRQSILKMAFEGRLV